MRLSGLSFPSEGPFLFLPLDAAQRGSAHCSACLQAGTCLIHTVGLKADATNALLHFTLEPAPV